MKPPQWRETADKEAPQLGEHASASAVPATQRACAAAHTGDASELSAAAHARVADVITSTAAAGFAPVHATAAAYAVAAQ